MFLTDAYAMDASENGDFPTDFAISTKALPTNGPTDVPTDGPTDRRTDKAGFRVA